MFKCSSCGLCCKNLNQLYSDLDRGDGICKHLNVDKNLCNIYNKRPLKCNIDESYKTIYSKSLSIEEYYELNYAACHELQKREREKCT